MAASSPFPVAGSTYEDPLDGSSKDASRPDTVRLESMRRSVWDDVLFTQPDSAFRLAGELFTEAKEQGSKKYMAQALRMQGIAKYLRGDQGEALNYYERCFAIEEERADTMGMSASLKNMAMIHKDRGALTKAMECCMRSLRFYEAKHSALDIATTLNQIGSILEAQNDLGGALEHYRQSLAMAEKVGNEELQAVALQNIGSLLISQGKFAGSLDFASRALVINERRHSDRSLGYTFLTMGIAMKGLGRLDEALGYETKSLRLREAMGDDRGIARCLLNMSDVYAAQGHHAKAIVLAKRALALAQKVEEVQGIHNAASSLYTAYKAMGRPGEALAMYELAVRMNDSLRTQENLRGVTEQRVQHEFEKKEAAAKAEYERQRSEARLELERTRSQRLLFLLGAGFILVSSALLLNRTRLKRRLQMAQLRARLSRDLHDDIGSTLSSISILSAVARKKAETGDGPGAAASLARISERSERLQRNMNDIVWSIDASKDTMEELLARMREFGSSVLEPKGILFRFESADDLPAILPPRVRSNLYLIFKEAVNNAAKHANAACVSVCIERVGAELRMQVADDGQGLEEGRKASDLQGGNGLHNMRSRAQEMKAELRIEGPRGKGTVIALSIRI